MLHTSSSIYATECISSECDYKVGIAIHFAQLDTMRWTKDGWNEHAAILRLHSIVMLCQLYANLSAQILSRHLAPSFRTATPPKLPEGTSRWLSSRGSARRTERCSRGHPRRFVVLRRLPLPEHYGPRHGRTAKVVGSMYSYDKKRR